MEGNGDLTMSGNFDKLESRLDRIEAKLDSHLERVAKSEEAISNLKGYMKIIVSVLTAIVSTGVMTLLNIKGLSK